MRSTRALRASLGYRSEVASVAAENVADAEFRHELFHTQGLAGRAMLVGERGSGLYGVSLFREQSAGFFSESENQAIQSIADTLISCVAKHHDLLARDTSLCALFSSVDELASRFAAIPAALSRRECEVCARIVYGMSMKEIARDLGITAETGSRTASAPTFTCKSPAARNCCAACWRIGACDAVKDRTPQCALRGPVVFTQTRP